MTKGDRSQPTKKAIAPANQGKKAASFQGRDRKRHPISTLSSI